MSKPQIIKVLIFARTKKKPFFSPIFQFQTVPGLNTTPYNLIKTLKASKLKWLSNAKGNSKWILSNTLNKNSCALILSKNIKTTNSKLQLNETLINLKFLIKIKV